MINSINSFCLYWYFYFLIRILWMKNLLRFNVYEEYDNLESMHKDRPLYILHLAMWQHISQCLTKNKVRIDRKTAVCRQQVRGSTNQTVWWWSIFILVWQFEGIPFHLLTSFHLGNMAVRLKLRQHHCAFFTFLAVFAAQVRR